MASWPQRARGQDAVGAVGRPAAQGRHCASHGRQAAGPVYDEPTTGLDPITATTVDEEIVKLRDLEGVSSIVVTHQLRDAFYIAGHTAPTNGGVRILPADEDKSEEAEFIMLRDGVIVFEGPAGELKRSNDPYLKTFLS